MLLLCLLQDGERTAAVERGEELGLTVSQREEEVVNVRLELGSVRNRVAGGWVE